MTDVLRVAPLETAPFTSLRGGAVDATRRAIVAGAQERVEELVEVVVASVFQALPEYSVGRPTGEVQDICAGIASSARICLSVVAHDRALTAEERRMLELTGGQRARQGVPKASVIECVKLATRAGLAFLMTCGTPDAEQRALTGALCDVARLIGRFEDEAVAALAHGHDEASAELLAASDKGEAVLVDRLLEGRFLDRDEVLAHAAHVGLARARPAYVVVATACGAVDEGKFRAAAAALRPRVLLAVGPGRTEGRVHVPLVVQPASAREWQRVLADLGRVAAKHEITFVHADEPADLGALADAYRPVRDSLAYLPAVTCRPGVVRSLLVRFHRAVCAGGDRERMALVQEVLGPLEALPERERTELLVTLDALYETGGSAAALAKHLHLHKNTVANRLRRAGALTGLDVRRPPERLVLETLLRIRHLAAVGS